MTRKEGLTALAATVITYLVCPDVLDKVETVMFMIAVWGMYVACIWAVEELNRRVQRARRIAKRRRRLANIDFTFTGLVDEKGNEVKRVG